MLSARKQIEQELMVIQEQIETASTMQASWEGINESYRMYWLGQKHAFKCKRADLNDRLEGLTS